MLRSCLRHCLLAFVAPLGLAAPVMAQPAVPAPAITPGTLVAPVQTETVATVTDETAGAPPPIPKLWAPVPRDVHGRTAYGLYLAGRLATARGVGEDGAAYLAAAQRLTPEQPLVREQAFLAALVAGDLDDAVASVPSGPEVTPVVAQIGRLVAVVQTYAGGDARGALTMLRQDPIQAPHALAGTLLTPWVAAAAGDWTAALAEPPEAAGSPVQWILRYDRARLLEIRRRFEEAEAEYAALVAAVPQETAFRAGYGAYLERRGRYDEAVALYAAAPQAPAQALRLQVLTERAQARRDPPVLDVRGGAAEALTTAAEIISSVGGEQFSPVYIRLALSIEPTDQRRMALGGALVRTRLMAGAREAYAAVSDRDPVVFAAARSQIAQIWLEEDDVEKATAEYRLAVAALPENPLTAYFLAGVLVQQERYDEALALLNGPVLNTPRQGAEIHFMRGAAYESTGRIDEAEAELWAAIQQQPDEPVFLNYLGYLWVDSGRRVAEGAEMIARAHAAAPDNGNIQDSLGWAQYRQGQYDIAVTTLEEAVAKEPANAEINDHLGDAYWQVGRRREAGFQWTRVLSLEPEPERRVEVERKLVEGLDTDASTATNQNAR